MTPLFQVVGLMCCIIVSKDFIFLTMVDSKMGKKDTISVIIETVAKRIKYYTKNIIFLHSRYLPLIKLSWLNTCKAWQNMTTLSRKKAQNLEKDFTFHDYLLQFFFKTETSWTTKMVLHTLKTRNVIVCMHLRLTSTYMKYQKSVIFEVQPCPVSHKTCGDLSCYHDHGAIIFLF